MAKSGLNFNGKTKIHRRFFSPSKHEWHHFGKSIFQNQLLRILAKREPDEITRLDASVERIINATK